jgi:hypothetical protein
MYEKKSPTLHFVYNTLPFLYKSQLDYNSVICANLSEKFHKCAKFSWVCIFDIFVGHDEQVDIPHNAVKLMLHNK